MSRFVNTLFSNKGVKHKLKMQSRPGVKPATDTIKTTASVYQEHTQTAGQMATTVYFFYLFIF